LLRITNMRGVNLNVFDFDYDLTWAGFFLNGHEKIYGRYGGRTAASADAYLTLGGLKHAMRAALEAHRAEPKEKPSREPQAARTVDEYPAAKRFDAGACIHCHQVYDFRRDALKAAGKWQLDEVWVYPMPENLGLTLDRERGDRVQSVKEGTHAASAGLRAGDVLKRVNGRGVASFADVQYALHGTEEIGKVSFIWQRGDQKMSADIAPPAGWRVTDICWRASMWALEPSPYVHGRDLSPREKVELGLLEKGLAFRQADYVPGPAKRAGIKQDDIIVGVDGKQLELTMLQFNVYVRINFKVGDRITFNVLRDGKRVDVPMTLTKSQE
jgi:hypothetical protein